MTPAGTVVFRPRLIRGGCLVLAGLPFAAIGGVGLLGVAGDAMEVGLMLFFLALGTLAAAGGVAAIRTRVVIGPGGLAKSPRWPNGFEVSWGEVTGWSVGPSRLDDSFTSRVATFRLAGGRVAEVYDSEAWRPGFDAFVAAVRGVAGDREETAEPLAAADRGIISE